MDGRATAIPMVGGSRLEELQPQKEEPKTNLCHATQRWARSILRDHTNQEAHNATWFGAQGRNTGPGLVIPSHVIVANREKMALYILP